MSAQTGPDRQAFYAVATWAVPGCAVVLPFLALFAALHLTVPLVVGGGLALLVVAALLARLGRRAVGGLVVGAVVGPAALLLAGAVLWLSHLASAS